jgi:alpha-galactosidase
VALKIAMIGAGSIGFTRRLMRDVLAALELADTTFAMTDISQRNLDMVAQLCRRDIEANNLPAKVTAGTDRRHALEGADYVICTIRQGGLEAFQTDIDIPLKYGIDQCVGDTICAGGIMYAQRTIPALLEFCKDIREAAKLIQGGGGGQSGLATAGGRDTANLKAALDKLIDLATA